MERFIAYLNTPHYYTEESLSYHDKCAGVIRFYDEGYAQENDPYTILCDEKMVELSKDIAPVQFRYTHKRIRIEILKTLVWDGEKWIC